MGLGLVRPTRLVAPPLDMEVERANKRKRDESHYEIGPESKTRDWTWTEYRNRTRDSAQPETESDPAWQ